jgi:hypothetical protein
MRRCGWTLVLAWLLIPLNAAAGDLGEAEAVIDAVLRNLHQAAADADGEAYFSLFTDDAVFLGTDATERWSVAEFRAFAEPYFSTGRGWTYVNRQRNITLSTDGTAAWFDEMLWNESYGTCRGTGVLVLSDGAWRIAQYNLTIPIPNHLAVEIAEKIKDYESRGTSVERR